MSRKMYGLLALALLSLAADALAQTIALGGEGRAWPGGGEEIDPQFRLSNTELAVGNTPGGVIDFAFAEGWIFPQQIDTGRNLALGAADRGGGMSSPLPSISQESLAAIIDEDAETAFRRKASAAGEVVIARGHYYGTWIWARALVSTGFGFFRATRFAPMRSSSSKMTLCEAIL